MPQANNMSKVLVTGGAGFIGSHIVDRLISDGHEVVLIDNLATGKRENLNPRAEFHEADISNYDSIKDLFNGVDAVFHTGALARLTPSVKNPLPAHASNVTGTLNVLWAAHNSGVKKLIFSSTSSLYGDRDPSDYPLKETLSVHFKSPYSAQKLMGEQYCKLFSQIYDLPTVILRYFNVYGPRQITEGSYATVVGIFLKQREKGEPMTIVSDAGERRRDYTHVSDIAEGNILAWKKEVPPAEIINLGRGKNYSVNEVAALIGGPTTKVDARPWDAAITLADNSKAKNMLGWEPKVSFEDGIAELKKLHGIV